MTDLLVPQRVPDPFREHYRALILGSALRAAETDAANHRANGHRLRSRRAELAAYELRRLNGQPAEPLGRRRRFGLALRASIGTVWLATLALLLLDLVTFGIESWTTSVADIGLIVFTFAWFWITVDDLEPIHPPGAGSSTSLVDR